MKLLVEITPKFRCMYLKWVSTDSIQIMLIQHSLKILLKI